MRSRLFTLVLAVTMFGSLAQPAFATHFDNDANTGSFNPQVAFSSSGTLVNRPSTITFDVTAADHEDAPIYARFRSPGDWQFPFATLRQGEKADFTTTTRCEDTLSGYRNSPNGTGTGGNIDFSKRTDAAFARAEKVGTARLVAHADGVSRPGDPIVWTGDAAFIAWDPATAKASLCLLFITTDSRVTSIPDPTPQPSSTRDDVEGVTEIVAQFPVQRVTDDSGTYWETLISDGLKDLVTNATLQDLHASLLQLKTTLFGRSVGNWHTGGATDFSVAPTVSGSKVFEAVMKACPPTQPPATEDPTNYRNCKSNGGTVIRTGVADIGLPAPSLTSPANGAFFTTNAVNVEVSGDPAATFRIFKDDVALGDITAGPSGVASGPISLPEGPHTITARTVDAGGRSPVSNARTFTVDVPPPPPEITGPAAGETLGQGTVTLRGTGQPNATIRLYEGTDQLGSTVVGGGGSWSKDVVLLEKGAHTLTATAADLGGEGDPSLPIAINVTTATPVFTSPAEQGHVKSLSVELIGTAEPGATVTISEGGVPVGTPVADLSGVFSHTTLVTEGEHTFSAMSSLDGFVSLESEPLTVTADVTAPSAPAISAPADGDVIGVRSVPFSGTGEPSATIVLRNGSTEIGTATVGNDGTWSKGVPLSDGMYAIDAFQRDRAGNESPATTPVSFEVNVPVIIATPEENSMNPQRPTIRVLGDVAATQARIYIGNSEIARAPMVNGVATVPYTFQTGSHTINARTLSSGQLGKPSAPRTFKVDATAPSMRYTGIDESMPIVFTPGTVLTGTGEDTGSATSGVKAVEVTFRDEQNVFVASTPAQCTGCTGPNISWRVVPSDVVKRTGYYNVSVVGTDAMGNVSVARRTKIFVMKAVL